MNNRDPLGRFTPGHELAVKGWEGLVKKRFEGDSVAAREWLAQLGRYGYGLAYYHPSKGYASWVKECFKVHPGSPEQFLMEWRRRLDFRLSDVGEMKF